MNTIEQVQVPQGWYPDPSGDNSLRWWDGSAWTDNIFTQAPAPEESSAAELAAELDRLIALDSSDVGADAVRTPAIADPIAVPGSPVEPAALPSRRELRAQWEAQAAAEAAHASPAPAGPVAPVSPVGSQSASSAPQTSGSINTVFTPLAPLSPLTPSRNAGGTGQSAISRMSAVPERGTFVPFATQTPWRPATTQPVLVNTLAAWVLALIPFIFPIVMIGVIFALDEVIPVIQLGISAVFVLWMLLLVVRDSRELKLAGHTKVASPAWILLTPLTYLIVRAVKVQHQTQRKAFGPPVVFALLLVIQLATLVLLPSIRASLV